MVSLRFNFLIWGIKKCKVQFSFMVQKLTQKGEGKLKFWIKEIGKSWFVFGLCLKKIKGIVFFFLNKSSNIKVEYLILN